MAILIIDCYIGLFGTSFMQVLYLGRAPCTKETLPDFSEKCRVTRHSRVFRGLTGSQRTPGFGASHSECDQIIMIMHSLQPRFARHLIGFQHIEFRSLVQALYGI